MDQQHVDPDILRAVGDVGRPERPYPGRPDLSHIPGEAGPIAAMTHLWGIIRHGRAHLEEQARPCGSIYRVRLGHAMQAIRDLRAKAGLGPFDDEFQREIEHALGAVHVLDQHHMERTRDVQDGFMETWTLASRDSVARAREEIAAELDGCAAVAIAGGHVAVLLSRLQMFLMDELLSSRELPIVAWSAGAMAITRQIVLFHDRPPQGRGDAEVLFAGLGLCSDLVALPHASRRLLLDDPHRVSVLAKRFAPASCVALDEGSRADWDGNRWSLGSGTRWLTAGGEVVKEQTFA